MRAGDQKLKYDFYLFINTGQAAQQEKKKKNLQQFAWK